MNFRSFVLIAATTSRANAFAFGPQSLSSIAITRRVGAAPAIVSFSQIASQSLTIRNMSSEAAAEPRKAGVATPTELKDFVSAAGSKLLVVDVRHPDASVEPGDAKSLTVAGFPDASKNYRPNAINLPWSRETKSMELPSGEDVAKDTPIITHCGGGGRGQKAKDFLESKGFTNVLNGGGPKETDCWAEFGEQ